MFKRCNEFLKDRYNIILLGVLLVSVALKGTTFFLTHTGTDEVVYQVLGKNVYDDPTNYTLRDSSILNATLNVFGKEVPFPSYYDQPLFHIPPLFVYMISLSYHIFGINPNSAALVPFLFGSITPLIVYLLGSSLFNKKVGLLASFLIVICPLYWAASVKVWNDVILTFFITFMVYVLYRGIEKNNSQLLYLAGFSGGLAFLTKQSAILIIPALIGFMIVKYRSFNWILDRKILLASAIALVVFSPWAIWVTSTYGVPWYLPEIPQELSETNPWFAFVGSTPWYYFILMLPLTAPIYLFSYMGILSQMSKKKRMNEDFLLLLLWIIAFIAFFSLHSGELRFILPALPALSIVASVFIVNNLKTSKVFRVLLALLLFVTIVISFINGYYLVVYRADLLVPVFL